MQNQGCHCTLHLTENAYQGCKIKDAIALFIWLKKGAIALFIWAEKGVDCTLHLTVNLFFKRHQTHQHSCQIGNTKLPLWQYCCYHQEVMLWRIVIKSARVQRKKASVCLLQFYFFVVMNLKKWPYFELFQIQGCKIYERDYTLNFSYVKT